MTKLLNEKFGHFSRRQKIEIYFPNDIFISYISYRGNVFQENIEMRLKKVFIIFEGFFE